MIDLDALLLNKFPHLAKQPLRQRACSALLRRLTRLDEIQAFLQQHSELTGLDFLDRVLEHFNFSYSAARRDIDNIPASGRALIVANHPFGALDGLGLLKLVSEVRPDVRILASDVLQLFGPLQSLLLPVDNVGGLGYKRSLKTIQEALDAEQAVIVFPAGSVSRMGGSGIRDARWQPGFLHFAKRSGAPIVPVHLGGRNSLLFYAASALYRPLGTLLLAQEMFNKHNITMPVKIGQPIPAAQLAQLPLSMPVQAKLFKKHVYRLGKQRPGVFATENTIAHPQHRQTLKRELREARVLGATSDGKRILLVDYAPGSAVMKELGRLRELSFRRVGEGTGQRLDLDRYDRYYRHIVLWDDEELEIAGAYRIAEAGPLKQQGLPLYSEELFQYAPAMQACFEQGLELGRSFVQPRYWGRRSLDYLWQGIGAYLRQHPHIRYLFGPVSISAQYPEEARRLLVEFYRHHFPDPDGLATARRPVGSHLRVVDACQDYQIAFQRLRQQLECLGVAVPTLYKQYTELCEPGGVRFLDFSVDPAFGHCVDGLVLVDLHYVEARKRARYLGEPTHRAA